MTNRDYLETVGLPVAWADNPALDRLRTFCQTIAARPTHPYTPDSLLRYPVPVTGPDGTCALHGQLASEPYDLAAAWKTEPRYLFPWLAVQMAWIERAVEMTGLDWLGLYPLRTDSNGSRTLVKCASYGRPSRAEFPLNASFAARSTNSAVGLSARARIIPDVEKHRQAGGAFYVCDPAVRSEACLPLLGNNGNLTGILDAESHAPDFFSEAILLPLIALAAEAGPWLESAHPSPLARSST